MTNSTISGSEFGVYLDHVQPSPFTSNTLSSAGRALWLYDGIAATTPLADNYFPGGGHVHLGGYSALAASTTFPALSYVLENSFDVPAGVTLTVQPGAVLNARRFVTFTVHGGLIAQGTASARITWRLDPSETLAWYGLRFYGGAKGTLAYTTIAGSTRGIYASRSTGDSAIALAVTHSDVSGTELGIYSAGVRLSPFTANRIISSGRALWLYDGIAATTPLAEDAARWWTYLPRWWYADRQRHTAVSLSLSP